MPTATATMHPPGKRQIDFQLDAPRAFTVSVAGSFNDWNPSRTPLKKNRYGVWKTTLSLLPGRYEYRFVVDGQWTDDPTAKESVANPYGSRNSVIIA